MWAARGMCVTSDVRTRAYAYAMGDRQGEEDAVGTGRAEWVFECMGTPDPSGATRLLDGAVWAADREP
jgi:hypothetical protein